MVFTLKKGLASVQLFRRSYEIYTCLKWLELNRLENKKQSVDSSHNRDVSEILTPKTVLH